MKTWEDKTNIDSRKDEDRKREDKPRQKRKVRCLGE